MNDRPDPSAPPTSSDRKTAGSGATRPQGDTGEALAVALEDPNKSGRPRIVAKGSGAIAEQILEIAFARGVKVRTDADLVEILSAVDIDSEVPLQALSAVAEILTYVYRAEEPDRPESGASGTPS